MQLSDLDQYALDPTVFKAPGYPADRVTLYSPVDNVHEALVAIISSATKSLDIAMYGFDDQDLVSTIIQKMADPAILVRLTLDSSQATGVHEKQLLADQGFVNADVSVGTSEKGAIMHLKAGVVDGLIKFDGSTNWSGSGEEMQDNQLTVSFNAAESAQLSARIDVIHTYQLTEAK
jgi:phosphatidylserine/phosphatidylglycerophosphate/cardiolipin synthase-like enzyme